MRIAYKCTWPNTTNDVLLNPLAKALTALEWLVLRRGPMAVGVMMGGMITSGMREAKTPDMQYFISNVSTEDRGKRPHSFSGFTVSFYPIRPSSRGHVRIRSCDTTLAPAIQPNYMSTKYDPCRRRLGDAHAGLRQHQRGDDHDRGKGSGSHPRGFRGLALTPHLPHGPWPAWPSLDCASLDTSYPNRIILQVAG